MHEMGLYLYPKSYSVWALICLLRFRIMYPVARFGSWFLARPWFVWLHIIAKDYGHVYMYICIFVIYTHMHINFCAVFNRIRPFVLFPCICYFFSDQTNQFNFHLLIRCFRVTFAALSLQASCLYVTHWVQFLKEAIDTKHAHLFSIINWI